MYPSILVDYLFLFCMLFSYRRAAYEMDKKNIIIGFEVYWSSHEFTA